MSWTLVTGGAKRLGAQICLTLARNGHSIVVHYRKSHQEALELIAKCREYGVEAECIQGDFTSPTETQQFAQRFIERFGAAENLVHNVGNYLIKSALNTSFEEWSDLFQVNLYSPILLTQALLPGITQARGNIINIRVSGINDIRANVHSTAYRMTKMCLLMYTRSLAKELASSQVSVNMVSPGQLENSLDKPDPTRIPMNRYGTLEEVANVVAFLLKKDQYITGQNIEVSGGLGL